MPKLEVRIQSTITNENIAYVQVFIRPYANNSDDKSEILRNSFYEIKPNDSLERGLPIIITAIERGVYNATAVLLNKSMQPIATNSLQFTLDGDRSCTISVNTKLPGLIIKGRELITLSLTRKRVHAITFKDPTYFDPALKIKVLATINSNVLNGLSFTSVVKDINKTGFKVEIYRVDGNNDNSGWNEMLNLDWMAWQ